MAGSRTALTLDEIARRLDRAGIPWVVFAGAAAGVYGADRPLTDVDILVSAAAGTRTAALFPEARVKRRGDGPVACIQLPGVDIVAGLDVMDVDDQMAARLTRHQIAGVEVPVIPAEDNILIKAMLGRGPEVGKHDWEDVEAMVSHLPALDWEYLCWRADQCQPRRRVEQAMQRLERLRRQEGEV
jgi:hypothetical protein